ncbi:MAG: hypothetical protein B7Z69_07495 [Actinobacteria bacterium 21-73-9]|nr:MAG: hypothetical protein B7Z69_07495 [Actinobacteria bacterium 21-73-9]
MGVVALGSPTGATTHPSSVPWASVRVGRSLLVPPVGFDSPIAGELWKHAAAWHSPRGVELSLDESAPTLVPTTCSCGPPQ